MIYCDLNDLQVSMRMAGNWNSLGVQKVFCRPRVRERAILLCAHTTIYRFYSSGAAERAP